MSKDKEKRLHETGMNAFAADSEAPRFYADEEYAAELADGQLAGGRAVGSVGGAGGAGGAGQAVGHEQSRDEADGATTAGRVWGILALVMAIAAWFIWPAVLAPAAMVTGVVSYVRWRRSAGAWAIALGLIAFVLYLATL